MDPKTELGDLTAIRAFFAAWVFLYHVDLHAQFSAYLGPFAGLIRHGYLGVDGFFMLSGLILAHAHPELAGSTAGARRFWGKRLARIYPVHLATLVILAVVFVTGLAFGLTPRDPGRFTLLSLAENLLLIQGWGVSADLAWNYPAWSVSTEWAGYLLFPAIWFFLGSWRVIIPGQLLFVCIPCLGLLAYASGTGLNLTFGWALPRFFLEFIIGMTAYRLAFINAIYPPNRMLAGAGLAITLAGAAIGSDFTAVLGLLLLLAALMMNAIVSDPPILGGGKALRFLGRLSYAFYMSFATVELLLAQFFRHRDIAPADEKLAYAASMTILTFALAISLHILVEIPCRRLAARRPQPTLSSVTLRL